MSTSLDREVNTGSSGKAIRKKNIRGGKSRHREPEAAPSITCLRKGSEARLLEIRGRAGGDEAGEVGRDQMR